MRKKLFTVISLNFIVYTACTGQKTDSSGSFRISGYVDAYYARYSDSVGIGKLEKFAAASTISNSFGLNIAQLSLQYSSPVVRATLTLQAGDIPQAVWSPVYNYIQEAYGGIHISRKYGLMQAFLSRILEQNPFCLKII